MTEFTAQWIQIVAMNGATGLEVHEEEVPSSFLDRGVKLSWVGIYTGFQSAALLSIF